MAAPHDLRAPIRRTHRDARGTLPLGPVPIRRAWPGATYWSADPPGMARRYLLIRSSAGHGPALPTR